MLSQFAGFGPRSRLLARYDQLVLALLATTFALSTLDLATSILAYGQGLVESNSLLLYVSSLLGVRVVDALVGSKVAFIAGTGLVGLLGMKTRFPMTKAMSFFLLLGFAAELFAVSANNVSALRF